MKFFVNKIINRVNSLIYSQFRGLLKIARNFCLKFDKIQKNSILNNSQIL